MTMMENCSYDHPLLLLYNIPPWILLIDSSPTPRKRHTNDAWGNKREEREKKERDGTHLHVYSVYVFLDQTLSHTMIYDDDDDDRF